MKLGATVFLLGLGFTSFGLAKLAFADTPGCKGEGEIWEGGWSFGCGDFQCPVGAPDCEIYRMYFEDHYLMWCTCTGGAAVTCCSLAANIDTTTAPNTPHWFPSGSCKVSDGCESGVCTQVNTPTGGGHIVSTAECK